VSKKKKNKISQVFFNDIMTPHRSLYFILQKVFGVGLYRASKLISLLGLPPLHLNKKLIDLPAVFRRKIYNVITQGPFLMGDAYKKDFQEKIEDLNNIKNLRTFNFMNGLPVRGQRTKTNARTSKLRVGRVKQSKVSE
jgi:small subunit ribosomal protein S13